jgi:hypothetical protein
MKSGFPYILLLIMLGCTGTEKHTDHYKALEKEWTKHLRPRDSIWNNLSVGQTFALESSETQGVDLERFRDFDYWKDYDNTFFERMETRNFSNPAETGGTLFSLEIFKALKKGETEVKFYKKHYYGNRDPKDSSYIIDTTTYLYNTFKFRIE